MAIQKIPLASIQKIRTYLAQSLVLPEAENHPRSLSLKESDDLPEPESIDELSGLFNLGGTEEDEEPSMGSPLFPWLISAVNPATPLRKLPGLRLKLGWRLVSYVYRSEGADRSADTGVTWAVPEEYCTTATLEMALRDCRGVDPPPRPQGALDDFMTVIEGDRTPPSFIIASLFRREIQEFVRHPANRDWTHHRLIDTPPTQLSWQWKTQVKDWSPKVRILDNGQVAVEFFTCRTTPPVALFRHVEQFPAASYQGKGVDQTLAVAVRK